MKYKIAKRTNIASSVRRERLTYSFDGIEDVVSYNDFLSIGKNFLKETENNNINLSNVDYLLGLDAGGIIPTISFSSATKIPFKLAWKLDLEMPNKEEFTEPFASGKSVFVYNLMRDKNIIIIDDEVTTGATIQSLYSILKKYNINVACALSIYKCNDNKKKSINFDFPLLHLSDFSMKENE